MPENDTLCGRGSGESGSPPTSRRAFLGSAATLTGASLAGCISDGGLGGGGTLSVGGIMPLSGPYGGPGENLRNAMELAVQKAREDGDAGDFDIEITYEDTQADPATGRRRAQELINDGIDILIGTFAANVEQAVLDVARGEDVITLTNAAARSYYLDGCYERHFSISSNPYNQSHATLGPLLEQGLGSTVYTIAANYSWGQNHRQSVRDEVVPKNDGEYLGNTFTELGQGDFSEALTKAENSGADIVYCALAGNDHAQAANQALEFGLYDQGIKLAFPFSGLTVAQQIDPAALTNENLYLGLQWYWEVETSDGNEFVEAHRDQFDHVPTSTEGMVYGTYRTAFTAVGETGSTAPDDIREAMVDRPLVKQLWGVDERYRACNQALIYPPLLVQGKPQSEWNSDNTNIFEVFNIADDPAKFYRSCEDTGCELPPV